MLLSDLVPYRGADCGIIFAIAKSSKPAFDFNSYKRRGVRHRQAAQTHGIQQLKNGSVRANAQCQCQDCGDCESRALAQCSQCESQVLNCGVDPGCAVVFAQRAWLASRRQRLRVAVSFQCLIQSIHRAAFCPNAIPSFAYAIRALPGDTIRIRLRLSILQHKLVSCSCQAETSIRISFEAWHRI